MINNFEIKKINYIILNNLKEINNSIIKDLKQINNEQNMNNRICNILNIK